MRRRTILLATLARAVVAATIGNVVYGLHTRAKVPADGGSYPGLHGPVAVVCPWPPDPATSPSQAGGFGIRPRSSCTPAFTQQDVRDYVVQVQGHLGPVIITGEPTVTRVVFLTISDLNRVGRERVGMSSDTPPDMLVCYAELRGTFSVANIGAPNTESAVSFVFDAHTGKQLVFVAGPLLG